MAINVEGRRTGQEPRPGSTVSEGTGKVGAANFKSPYPYTTRGTTTRRCSSKPTAAPSTPGRRFPIGAVIGAAAQLGGGAPASSIAAMLTPKYRETFVQEMKAATEGRIWSANSIRLPGGYFDALGAEEFVVTLGRVYSIGSGNGSRRPAGFIRTERRTARRTRNSSSGTGNRSASGTAMS